MSEYSWLTTQPNPRSPATGHDAGQRGWKLHAIAESGGSTFAEVRNRRAKCGLLPRHGWGLDLFIEDRCARCEQAIAATERRAVRGTGKA